MKITDFKGKGATHVIVKGSMARPYSEEPGSTKENKKFKYTNDEPVPTKGIVNGEYSLDDLTEDQEMIELPDGWISRPVLRKKSDFGTTPYTDFVLEVQEARDSGRGYSQQAIEDKLIELRNTESE